MYSVVFKKQIHSCFASLSSNDKWMFIETELPFVPSTDISIKLSPDLFINPIEVVWINEKKYFIVYVEPDKELYNKARSKPESILDFKDEKRFKEIIKEHQDLGWDIDA